MIVRQGRIRHFVGKDGVWYSPENDTLWVFKRGELGIVVNHRMEIETYDRYHVWSDQNDGELLVLKADTLICYIGEFE